MFVGLERDTMAVFEVLAGETKRKFDNGVREIR